jgi:hypothetical protein
MKPKNFRLMDKLDTSRIIKFLILKMRCRSVLHGTTSRPWQLIDQDSLLFIYFAELHIYIYIYIYMYVYIYSTAGVHALSYYQACTRKTIVFFVSSICLQEGTGIFDWLWPDGHGSDLLSVNSHQDSASRHVSRRKQSGYRAHGAPAMADVSMQHLICSIVVLVDDKDRYIYRTS